MNSLIGGRIRDVNKFHKHEYCLNKGKDFLCFDKNLISNNSQTNKFYVILDLVPTVSIEDKILYYKNLYLNILYNFNVQIDNIFMISNTTIPPMLAMLYGKIMIIESFFDDQLELTEDQESLNSETSTSVLSSSSVSFSVSDEYKRQTIHKIADFFQTNIVSKIKHQNLSDCSIIFDVMARGTINLDQFNDLISLTGNVGQDEIFLTCDDFYSMMEPLYQSNGNKIRDITYIMNSCYSAFKFGGVLFDYLSKRGVSVPNSNLFSSKPMLVYVYILILFLENNPISVDWLSNVECLRYIEVNLLNLGLGCYINYIASFRDMCEESKSMLALKNLVNLQKTLPFKGDRSDKNVLSNKLLLLFDEINNETSYLLFHYQLDGPFKHLDILKTLDQNFTKFNSEVTKFYQGLVNEYFSTIDNQELNKVLENDESTISFSIKQLKFMHNKNNVEFINLLIKKSFNDIPHCFLRSLNQLGTRYKSKDPILLSEIF